jgi:hypothetical protein
MFPEFPRLQGEEAIEALHNLIKELDGRGNRELTKKQNNALKKAAKGIIVSIETEKKGEPQNKEMGFASRLRKSIVRSDKSGRTSESRRLWRVAE